MLELALLGAVKVTADGIPLDPPRSRNARVLLAMLALERAPLSRELLAERLWPDKPGTAGRDSLNNELALIRRSLGSHGELIPRYRSNVALLGDDVWVDAREFDDAYDAGDVAKAITLWRGPFMQDTDGAWVLQQRERCRMRMVRLLVGAADAAETSGDLKDAVDLSRRWVAVAEEDEEAVATLIKRLMRIGNTQAAKREFHRHARLLRERGRAPSAAVTRALASEPSSLRGPTREQQTVPIARRRTTAPLTSPGSRVRIPEPLLTGLPDLDRCIGGLPIGLTIIASRPRVGATALITRILYNVVTRLGVPSILFSTDLPESETALRLIAATGRVHLDQLRDGKISESSWPRVLQGSQQLADVSLFVDDSPDLTFDDAEVKVIELAGDGPPIGLIVIDDLQGMSEPPESAPRVLARLRRLGRAHHAAVVVTTQVHPRVSHRALQRPTLSDIPAYDPLHVRPELILALYREEACFAESERPGELDILIEENRHGPVGEVTVALMAPRATVLPLAHLPDVAIPSTRPRDDATRGVGRR
jgi:DNA-binding SARP family transcriptional activator